MENLQLSKGFNKDSESWRFVSKLERFLY